MKIVKPLLLMICGISLLIVPGVPALAQQAAGDTVRTRQVTIWSEGTRMAGTVFTPTSAGPNDRLPTILMAHGWGGIAAQLARDARAFASAGYLVVTFDYRGWGNSDSRVILADGAPPADQRQGGRFTAEVIEVREVVDPVDMLADWENALHWLHGEPQVDTTRIGVWGSSQSGGYVVEMAIRDSRIRAVHSQVGALTGHGMGTTPEARDEGTRRARGEIGYPEPGATVVGNLRGAPIAPRFANYPAGSCVTMVIAASPRLPSLVAAIIAVPAATAVTVPLPSTPAIASAVLDHVTGRPERIAPVAS